MTIESTSQSSSSNSTRQPVSPGTVNTPVRNNDTGIVSTSLMGYNEGVSVSSDEDDSSEQSRRLRRNLGLISSISYVAGGIIGVGIFVSPQSVLQNVDGSVGIALCVWAFCAGVAFCGGLTYAELGTRIRKSGGAYTYVREAWGDCAGFVFLWTQLVVVRPMATSLGAMTAAEYTLRPIFLHCPELVPRSAKTLLALCILCFLVFLNSYDTSWGAVIQTLSTVCKLAALFIIIVIGVIFFCRPEGRDNLQDLFSYQHLTAGGLSLAVYSCNYAYMGWDNLNIAAEEVKNPQRHIPLAIMLAVALTACVYILAILSYHTVLTTGQVLSGLAVAAVFSEATVPHLMWIIVPCIAMSAIGIVNVIIFTSTRFNFIGGRDNLFPELLSMICVTRRTPLLSCLVLGFLAAVVVLLGDVKSVLGAYSLFRASGETAAILGIFRLRRRFPASPSTYQVPTVLPVLYLVIHLSLAVVAITRDTSRYVTPLLMVLSGIPIYFVSTSRLVRLGPVKSLNDFLVNVCRKLLLSEFASKTY